MAYPGGKAGPGVFQALINQIPPHDTYCAAFAGFDAICRYKRPASKTILIDRDPETLQLWTKYFRDRPPQDSSAAAVDAGSGGAVLGVGRSTELHLCDAVAWLKHRFNLFRLEVGPPDLATLPAAMDHQNDRFFLFVDPPYPMATRSSGPMYKHEMTDAQHDELLATLVRLPCMVMVCSYPNERYRAALSGWRTFFYHSVARSGEKRREQCWCNYPEPTALHDARYVGSDKRQRERIRRRMRRLSGSLNRLPPIERQAILDGLERR